MKNWLEEHPNAKLDGLAYYGTYPQESAGIKAPMPPTGCDFDPRQKASKQMDKEFGSNPGWYALSVNYLYDRTHQYRYFLEYEPVAMAGYSIYIYHIAITSEDKTKQPPQRRGGITGFL